MSDAQGAVIEILERRTPHGGIGDELVVPHEIRINGMKLLAPKDHPVIFHEQTVPAEGGEPVLATITLFVKRLVVENRPPESEASA